MFISGETTPAVRRKICTFARHCLALGSLCLLYTNGHKEYRSAQAVLIQFAFFFNPPQHFSLALPGRRVPRRHITFSAVLFRRLAREAFPEQCCRAPRLAASLVQVPLISRYNGFLFDSAFVDLSLTRKNIYPQDCALRSFRSIELSKPASRTNS